MAEHLVHALRIGPRRLGGDLARRSLEAATICMALVIFCVALTEAMRLRRSFRLGMGGSSFTCPDLRREPAVRTATAGDWSGAHHANVLA